MADARGYRLSIRDNMSKSSKSSFTPSLLSGTSPGKGRSWTKVRRSMFSAASSRGFVADEDNEPDDTFDVMDYEGVLGAEYEQAQQILLGLDPVPRPAFLTLQKFWEWLGRFRQHVLRREAVINDHQDKIVSLQEKLDSYSEFMTKEQKIALEQEMLELMKKTDASHIREQDQQEKIDSLREQVRQLEIKLEEKEREAAEVDADLNVIGKTREGFIKEKERVKKLIAQAEAAAEEASKEKEEFAFLYENAKTSLEELKSELTEKIDENSELTKAAKNAQKDLADLKAHVAQVNTEYETLYELYQKCVEELGKHKNTNYELAVGLDELYNENEEYEETEAMLREKIYFLKNKLTQVGTAYEQTHAQFKFQEEELFRLRKLVEQARASRVKDAAAIKVASKDDKGTVALIKQQLEAEVLLLERNLTLRDKKLVDCEKKVEKLILEKQMVADSMMKTINVNNMYVKQLQSQTSALQAMEATINQLRSDIRTQTKGVEIFKREKSRLTNEKRQMLSKMDEVREIAKAYKVQLVALRKLVSTKDLKLKKDRNLMETVWAEKNSQYSMLQETRYLLKEQNQKTRVISTQIEQLKEEVTSKDAQLMRVEIASRKLKAEVDAANFNAKRVSSEMKDMKYLLEKKEKERAEAQRSMINSEELINDLKKRNDKAQQDLGTLKTQLDRRIIELGLVYEKVNLMDHILRQGENQYKERLEDIRLLKIEIKKLRAEKEILLKNYKNMADLRHEIYLLNRDLTEERQKCHALQEEMETPINFHRWRILERTDPSKRELIDKVNLLQKKLFKVSEIRSVEKERFNDLEAVYTKMKKSMENLPGQEAFQQIEDMRKALQQKNDENRIFSAEVAAYEGELLDYKFKVDQLTKQLNETKKQYYEIKLQHDRMKIKGFQPVENLETPPRSAYGGGFAMKAGGDK